MKAKFLICPAVLLSVACGTASSTDNGARGGGTSVTTGGDGTTTTTTTTGGGTGGAPSDDASVTDARMPEASVDVAPERKTCVATDAGGCHACVDTNCCNELDACHADTRCVSGIDAYNRCIRRDGDTVDCLLEGVGASGDATDTFAAVVGCLDMFCTSIACEL